MMERRASRHDVIRRAQGLVDAGQVAKARSAMRSHLARHPDDLRVRMALAEHYRSSNVPSEAARWGIVTPGWATDREVRDLRRWLLGRYDVEDYVRELLELPASEELPAELSELVVPEFRTSRPVEQVSSGMNASTVLGCLTVIIVLIAVTTPVYFVGRVLNSALLDLSDVRDAAGEAATASLIGVAVVAAVVGPWWIRSRIRSGQASSSGEPERPAQAVGGGHGVELAWQLFERGEERTATILLRSRLHWTSEGAVRSAARAALTEMARRRARSAEAGRWGIGVVGLTTPLERRAFSAALVGAREPVARFRQLAELHPTDQLNEDAVDVVRRVSKSAWTDADAIEHDAARSDQFTVRAALSAAVVVVVGSEAVVLGALSGWYDPTFVAQTVLIVAAVPLVAMMGNLIAADLRARARRRAQ